MLYTESRGDAATINSILREIQFAWHQGREADAAYLFLDGYTAVNQIRHTKIMAGLRTFPMTGGAK